MRGIDFNMFLQSVTLMLLACLLLLVPVRTNENESKKNMAIRSETHVESVTRDVLILIKLETAKRKEWQTFCGGFIVTNQHILSAASCLKYRGKQKDVSPNQLQVVTGVHDMDEFFEKWTYERFQTNVKKIACHPEFKKNSRKYNIAVITLTEQIILINTVKPIYLPVNDVLLYQKATTTGCNKVEYDGEKHKHLHKFAIMIVSPRQCELEYSDFDSSLHICGKSFNSKEYLGKCDVGNALTDGNTIVGIVSFAKWTCDSSKPIVFTNIFKHLGFYLRETGQTKLKSNSDLLKYRKKVLLKGRKARITTL